MKKYVYSIIAALCMSSTSFATAPDYISTVYDAGANRSMAVSLSPLQLMMMSLDAKVLFKLSDDLALTIPVVLQFVPENNIFKTKDILFTSAGAGVRYHFSGDGALQSGFFLEGSLALGYSQITAQQSASHTSLFLRPTATLGYSWAFDSGFALNIAVGGYYNHSFSPEAHARSNALTLIPDSTALSAIRDLGVRQGLVSGFAPTAEVSLSFAW